MVNKHRATVSTAKTVVNKHCSTVPPQPVTDHRKLVVRMGSNWLHALKYHEKTFAECYLATLDC